MELLWKWLSIYSSIRRQNSAIKSSFNLCGLVECGGPDSPHPPPIPVTMLLMEKGYSDGLAKVGALDKFQQFVDQINSLHL